MNYWLMKTEPSEYSYDSLAKDGDTVWDGVTNNLALKHLRSTRKGDAAFIYHTGNEKQIVGIAEIISDPYATSRKNPRLVVVKIKPKQKLRRPVTLTELRAQREFSRFELVRLPRLSVMPVPRTLWEIVLGLSKRAR
jgi:predicted RNA-binding protein with PUA-like domain